MSSNERQFDCLAMKEQVQAELYEAIKEMGHEEQIAYLRERAEAGPLADWWKRVKRAGKRSEAA